MGSVDGAARWDRVLGMSSKFIKLDLCKLQKANEPRSGPREFALTRPHHRDLDNLCGVRRQAETQAFLV